MKVVEGEGGEKYIQDFALIHFDLVIIVSASRESTFAKELYRALRRENKHVM